MAAHLSVKSKKSPPSPNPSIFNGCVSPPQIPGVFHVAGNPNTNQNFQITLFTSPIPFRRRLLLQLPPTMLLRGFTSAPLSCSLRLNGFTSAANPRNVAVAVSPQPPPLNTTFSVSDKDLESRGFVLHRTVSDLNLDHLNSVFVAVGFPKRDTDKIRIALENTDALLWIQYSKTQRPVAFARATGDGVFNAIIWDVVVDPSFQGIGLGKAVMERIIEDLLRKGICNIALYSEPRVLGFYRPLGFVADPDGIRGMVYSRKKKRN